MSSFTLSPIEELFIVSNISKYENDLCLENIKNFKFHESKRAYENGLRISIIKMFIPAPKMSGELSKMFAEHVASRIMSDDFYKSLKETYFDHSYNFACIAQNPDSNSSIYGCLVAYTRWPYYKNE